MNQENPVPMITEKRAAELAERASELARAIDDTITRESLALAGKLDDDELGNVQFSGVMLVIIRRALRMGIPFEHLAEGMKHTYAFVEQASRPKP